MTAGFTPAVTNVASRPKRGREQALKRILPHTEGEQARRPSRPADAISKADHARAWRVEETRVCVAMTAGFTPAVTHVASRPKRGREQALKTDPSSHGRRAGTATQSPCRCNQ